MFMPNSIKNELIFAILRAFCSASFNPIEVDSHPRPNWVLVEEHAPTPPMRYLVKGVSPANQEHTKAEIHDEPLFAIHIAQPNNPPRRASTFRPIRQRNPPRPSLGSTAPQLTLRLRDLWIYYRNKNEKENVNHSVRNRLRHKA